MTEISNNIHFFNLLVAGHGTDRLPDGDIRTELFEQFNQLIVDIRTVVAETPLLPGDPAGTDARPLVRIVTGDSPGVEQEACRIAQQMGAPLHLVVLGQVEGMGPPPQGAERLLCLGARTEKLEERLAHEIRGEIALAFADAMVVVWDGETVSGSGGGLVHITRQAALARKPVIWLQTDGSIRILDIGKLDDARLHQLNSRPFEIDWLKECFQDVADGESLFAELRTILCRIVNPGACSDEHDHEIAKLKTYLAGTPPSTWLRKTAGMTHAFLSSLLRLDFPGVVKALKPRNPLADFSSIKHDDAYPVKLPSKLLSRFALSDLSATVAAGMHRDMSWVLYLFSALAVFAAVAGAIHLWPVPHGAWWSILELMLVSAIVFSVWWARTQAWHEKWVGHRFVAEQLRYACMGFPLLALPKPFLSPLWQVNTGATRPVTLRSAELWLLHRTLVAEGIPHGSASSFTPVDRESVLKFIQHVTGIIEDQIGFHKVSGHRLHTCHENMHRLSQGLFVMTFLAVMAHFVLHAAWLLVFTAFLPALAAALHGIMTKQEMARLAGQSEQTVEKLTHLAKAFNRLTSAPESKGADWQFWQHARHLTLETAAVLSDESAQWQQLMAHQVTELPA